MGSTRIGAGTAESGRRNRAYLRQITQGSHDRAERRWHGIAEAGEDLAPFLAAMRVLHRDHGLPAAAWLGLPGAEALEERRLAALETDLDTPPGHAASDAQQPSSRDAAWGVLYALNGSALGATMLLRAGSAVAGRPSAYLTVMSDYARSGALGAFFRALNREPLDEELAGAGAVAVFSAMARLGSAREAAEA